jgi:hypothetical protein
MREDPVISGGLLKLLLVLLVAAGLGVGAFAIVGDGLPFDLPDLPDIEDTTNVTTLQDTDLQDTTINGTEPELPAAQAGDPFTSATFGSAAGSVLATAGNGARVTRVTINDVQTQFIVLKGKNEAEAYSVRADSGDVVREEATITVSGTATLDDFAFALSSVEPAAIDRMVTGARKQSKGDFEPGVLTLERAIPFGSRDLRWTINGQSDGRYVLYRAEPDGSGVRNEGGEGVAVPPAAQEAQKLGECIEAAGNDTNQILECLENQQ